MKYYNEETVRQIVKDAMEYGMSISQTQPMDIEHYPNIEIKEPHGRLGDLDEVEKAIKARIDNIDRKENGDWLSHDDAMFCNGLVRAIQSIKKIPTILEAST